VKDSLGAAFLTLAEQTDEGFQARSRPPTHPTHPPARPLPPSVALLPPVALLGCYITGMLQR
jgi:hypothetical protein